MSVNQARIRKLLREGEFRSLFIEELGWDKHDASLIVPIDGQSWALQACAQKRGMVAYLCPLPVGAHVPDYATRRRIEHQVAKAAHEHLVVFMDPTKAAQIWQWVRREAGKPTACREHHFHSDQTGEALSQKLLAIAFTLDEEESITLTDVTRRARKGFDVERVTKRFYDQFKKEHAAFLKFITGITESTDREWYASVMLNRLMFVYFIQRKGFLDGDSDYLRNRLTRCKQEKGKDKFYSFYRYFLLRLFHEGLGGKTRTAELEKWLGRIPYLNGGLFEQHQIERNYEDIQIPDKAFERIFDYFDQYQWHLDERPLRSDNEINPDVLGYIFEKYINQKQMGAYYTKEDITEYISKNTVLPFLFDVARAKCEVAFENSKGPSVWDLLKADPDRYIYPAVRHGAERPLTSEIAAGVNPPTLHQPVGDGPVQTLEIRKNWNKPAPPEFALPTETWREVVARRTRYEEIRGKLASGEIRDINEFITLNLDIRQFAQDVIENCEGPDLLRAFWHVIETITILDPTCGSGAFLFAALNVLEPLYEACLDRMEAFVEDLDRSGEKHSPEKFSDFRKVLERVASHPNSRYFIFKNIILNNLFGVDIMEEAVEICKLRLFLKLAAQVEPDRMHGNLGIDPLPDIDFNIKAGNTLVGYINLTQIREAAEKEQARGADGTRQSKLLFPETSQPIKRIEVLAADLQQAFDAFRKRQVEGDSAVPTEQKMELRKRLAGLQDELNCYLAAEYRVDSGKKAAYVKWLKSHEPFHWFVEFYGIMASGGFDVIIGNPPWKEYAAVKKDYAVKDYTVERSGNLYALCSERSLQILAPHGYFSFIVQLPLVSSSRMVTLREYLAKHCIYLNVIPCDDRPGKLFDGLQHCRSCIFVARKRRRPEGFEFYTTRYNRWASEVREALFKSFEFTPVTDTNLLQGQFPKVGGPMHLTILEKLFAHRNHRIQNVLSTYPSDYFIFYQEATQYWVKATVGVPYYAKNGKIGAPAHGRYLFFRDSDAAQRVCAVLNSSLFYSYFIAYGDCFHLSDTLATGFPIASSILSDRPLVMLAKKLMKDLKKHAERKTISTKDGDKISYDEFNVGEVKPVLDEIDHVLARHYSFTEEELDFIINYDIKYRIGRDAEGEDD